MEKELPNTIISEKWHFLKIAYMPFSRKTAFFYMMACQTGP